MLKYVLRVMLAAALVIGVSTLAVAQYGGMPGMPGMPGTPTYTPHTYSSKGPIIGGVMGAMPVVASFTGNSIIEQHCKAA